MTARAHAIERLPNFFVIGAAKCGTTTLYDLLEAHPDVFVPVLKEPQFFSSDIRYAEGIEQYERTHFSKARAVARGDFSPHYLAFEKCAARIRESIPAPGHRFVVILRDPVERAYSLYWNLVAEGVETLPFEAALAAELTRIQDPELERHGSLRFRYFTSGCFGAQLTAWHRYFPRRCFLVLTLDELRTDPRATVHRVCEFLAIPALDPLPRKRVSNAAGSPVSPALHRFLRNPHWIKEPLKRLLPDETRHRLIDLLFAWNRRQQTYEPMNPGTERALRERFASDVALLTTATGIDFSHWLPGSRSSGPP